MFSNVPTTCAHKINYCVGVVDTLRPRLATFVRDGERKAYAQRFPRYPSDHLFSDEAEQDTQELTGSRCFWVSRCVHATFAVRSERVVYTAWNCSCHFSNVLPSFNLCSCWYCFGLRFPKNDTRILHKMAYPVSHDRHGEALLYPQHCIRACP